MIDFWFTTGSTYTYLTVMRLPEIEKACGVRFNWRPFSRQRAANVEGAPFVEGSSKAAYMWHDIERRAVKYGISVRVPAPYPSIDTKLRDCVALLGMREGWGQSFVRASYTRWLQQGEARDGIVDIATSLIKIGQGPERIVRKAGSPEILGLYDSESSQARELGIFGSPKFVVDHEIFWGDDHLEDAVSWHQTGRLAANAVHGMPAALQSPGSL